MHCVEFGSRAVHIVDVEPHLLCDSTIVVETDYLKHLVARCPRTRVGSGRLQTDDGEAFASDRDKLVTKSHHARLEVAPHLSWPLTGRNPDRREADDLSATFHRDLVREQLL